MSPVKFSEEDRSRVVLNGPRPSPLRIGKDSHVIQKPSNSSNQIAMNIATQIKVTQQHQQQRQPVIIYTHSPKIIHTKPRDFMALVQKLTGFSRSNETKIEGGVDYISDQDKHIITSHEQNDSSSVTSEEKYEGENKKEVKKYMAEIPLFTPSSNNLFFSPQGSFSPSFLEFLNMKELPEY